MKRTTLKRIHALLLLVILFTAYAGQQLHIYLERPEHFAAFNSDPAADDTARSRVVQQHVVDDFSFYPCLIETQFAPRFRAEVLAVVRPAATHCKRAHSEPGISLRAPPAV